MTSAHQYTVIKNTEIRLVLPAFRQEIPKFCAVSAKALLDCPRCPILTAETARKLEDDERNLPGMIRYSLTSFKAYQAFHCASNRYCSWISSKIQAYFLPLLFEFQWTTPAMSMQASCEQADDDCMFCLRSVKTYHTLRSQS